MALLAYDLSGQFCTFCTNPGMVRMYGDTLADLYAKIVCHSILVHVIITKPLTHYTIAKVNRILLSSHIRHSQILPTCTSMEWDRVAGETHVVAERTCRHHTDNSWD